MLKLGEECESSVCDYSRYSSCCHWHPHGACVGLRGGENCFRNAQDPKRGTELMHELVSYIAPHFSASLHGPLLLIVLSGIGFFIGIIAGLFGVGGGFLLVPVMNILLGIPAEVAAGSATCYIIGTSTSGVLKHWKNKNIEIKAALFLAFGSMFGAVFGDMLQNYLIHTVAGGNAILFNRIMQGFFLVLLLAIAWIMYRDPGKQVMAKSFLQRIHFGPVTDLPFSGRSGVSIAGLLIIGFSGGLLTGLMGVSGGVLFLPILVVGAGILPHLAVGTSLSVVFVASVSAVVKKGLSGAGKVSLPIAVSLLIAGTLGVKAGMFFAGKLSGNKLRRYFSLIAVAAAVMVAVKLLF